MAQSHLIPLGARMSLATFFFIEEEYGMRMRSGVRPGK